MWSKPGYVQFRFALDLKLDKKFFGKNLDTYIDVKLSESTFTIHHTYIEQSSMNGFYHLFCSEIVFYTALGCENKVAHLIARMT